MTATTKKAPENSQKGLSAIDKYFKVTERGSTVGRELRGGLVTFFAMAYIVVLNPLILGNIADSTGVSLTIPQVAGVTALVAGVMTIIFGLVANYPFAIATGLGINTLVAVTLVKIEGLTWPQAMGLVVIEGIIIVILAFSGFRHAVFKAIPKELKAAITVGIGIFIALIGFVDAGFVRRIPDAANTTVPVGLGISGSIASWPTFVFVLGLIICGVLMIRKVPGALFFGIVANTVIAIIVEKLTNSGASFQDGKPVPTGWSLTVPGLPSEFVSVPDLSLVGKVDLFGAFTNVGVLAASMLVFTLVLANFFDAMGTMTGLGLQAGLADKDGVLPDMKKALVVEGLGAVAGGLGSASSNTVFVESSSGIADGARTGIANIATGVLFLIALFLTPLTSIIPMEAAAPALVVVGALMMSQIRHIDFRDLFVALPAFLTIVAMPYTYSIANGIGIGFIAWVIFQTAAGKAKHIHPLMWAVSVAFMLNFVAGPINALLH